MSIEEKSLDDIREEILEIGMEETGIKNFKSTGKLRAIWETFARVFYKVYSEILNLFTTQITWRSATGFILKIKALELGISPADQVKTEGNFRVTAYSAGTVTSGKWLKTTSGLRFKVIEDTSFVSGEFDIPVEAEFVGEKYNLIAGTSVAFTSVVTGVDSVAVPSDWITQSGTDEEDDETLQDRISAKWDAQGDDNRPSKYETLAREVSGVQDVVIIRAPRGPGSVNVVVASTSGLPSDELIEKVNEAIANSRLVARDTLVLGPTAINRDFILEFSGNSTKDEVEEKLQWWILNRSIGESIKMKDLYQDALTDTDNDPVLDIDEYEFTSPTQDILCSAEYEKIIPSSITATKVDE